MSDLEKPDELEPVQPLGACLIGVNPGQPHVDGGVGCDEPVDVHGEGRWVMELSRPGTIAAVTRLLASVVLLTVVLLSACSGAERAVSDAGSEAASAAGCSVARAAVGEVRRQVDGITSDIRADPEAAGRELTAAREALGVAEKQLTGETQEQVARAGAAIDDLRAEARAVADGASVDDRALRAAQEEYGDAVEQLTGLC